MAGRDQHAGIARIWGETFLTLGVQAGREDGLLAELAELVALFDSQPDFERALASPLVDDEIKRALIEKTLRGRTSDLLVDAVQVLRRKGRLDLVREVERAFHAAWLRHRGRVEVRVTSVVPLRDDVRAELVAAARRRTGREPILVERLDPDLIGGVVIAIEDQKYDGSVARELAKLERYLLERGSRELIAGSYFTDDTDSTRAAR
jgi:F-type H+-transporting ATPase subunit delta